MMTVYGSKDCVHCRSVVSILEINKIPYQFIEMKDMLDQVRLVDEGTTYTGLNEIMDMLYYKKYREE